MAEIKCPKCGEIIKLDKSAYDALLNEVEKEELDKRVGEQAKLIEEKYKAQLNAESAKLASEKENEVLKLQQQIEVLRAEIDNNDSNTQLKVATALEKSKEELNKKEQEITKLKGDVDASKKDAELAILKASQKSKEEINYKDIEINKLKAQIELAKKEAKADSDKLAEQYRFELEAKDAEIKRWKEYRMGDSTKDLGESLEQYCCDEFDSVRSYAFPNASFEKDTTNVDGTKGDFIFKENTDDGIEIVSIMFEMKNQKEDTEHKHKNEEFFKKLDKDRKNKGCEYAVLVSTLEADSKLYNSGIVDVSHKFPKMYVIRPQNFLAIIGLIRNMALENVQYKRSLVAYQQENIDVTNFEDNVKLLMNKIANDYDNASKQYAQVNKMCDDMIKQINEFRELFRLGQKWIGAAQNQLPNLEVRKLIKNNPTMQEKFAQIKKGEE